jgi:hypothetical protein
VAPWTDREEILTEARSAFDGDTSLVETGDTYTV